MQQVKEYAAVNGDVENRSQNQQPRSNYAPQQQPQQPANQQAVNEASKTSVPARSIEKIVKPEKDLTPKYTVVDEAIKSVLIDGDYYEDYVRGSQAELLKSKEFVLLAIAQNHNRFYAPETPKPAEWLDEEYLAERISFFFDRTKESIKEEENDELADNLYHFFRKNAFSADAHRVVNDTLKLVAKVNAAKVTSIEECERFKGSLNLFNSAVNSALNAAKEKYIASVEAERIRAEELAAEKKNIVGIIDSMKFDF